MISLEVDFNRRDDDGWVPARRTSLSEVGIGQKVTLFDDEGNHCLATIKGVNDLEVKLEPDWSTFVTAGEIPIAPAER